MIFLQVSLNEQGNVALVEAITLLVVTVLLGWWLGRLTFYGRTRTLRQALETGQTRLAECRAASASLWVPPLNVSEPKEVVPTEKVLEKPTPIRTAPALDLALPSVETLIPSTSRTAGDETDDLKILEGIGPRLEELLHEAGIKTFTTLAATLPGRLQEILNGAGPRYQMHDPTTWPDQARFAAEGRWAELRAWQLELTKEKIK